MPPSQETGGASSLLRMPLACVSGQPSTPAREGEEESMRLCRISAFAFLILAVLLLQTSVFPSAAAAQTRTSEEQNNATLAGTITDPSAAAIPDAVIVAK